jgi:hypothetical protein
MTFVTVVSFFAVLDAIREHFIMPLPPAVLMLLNLFGLVCLAAIVAFCVSMRWFCEQAALPEAAKSWWTTTVLFVAIYLIPLGLLHVAGVFAKLTGSSFNFNLGPFGLLLLVVFVVPLIHLFVSTSRMKRAAEEAAFRKPPPLFIGE